MVDAILVAFSSAHLLMTRDAMSVGATIQIRAFCLGSGAYIYLSFTINLLIIMLSLEEASQINLWKNLLRFDHTDPRALMISVLLGRETMPHSARPLGFALAQSTYGKQETDIERADVILYDNRW